MFRLGNQQFLQKASITKSKRTLLSFLVVLGIASAVWAGADEVRKMTRDELRSMLGNPEVVILDMRSREGWIASKQKIKGAMRENWVKVDDWADKYPKNLTLVLYCD